MIEREPEPSGDHDTARLRVDLEALGANWRALDRLGGPDVATSAVVKGDGYGLGLIPAAITFNHAGCTTFFVASPREGATLRDALPGAAIYILDGLLPGAATWYGEHDLRPVLSSMPEIDQWLAARTAGVTTGCAVHVDTGMNRLGLSMEEFFRLAGEPGTLPALVPSLIMSHLACADVADNPANSRQLQRFNDVRRRVPGIAASLANSAGVLLGTDYHFNLTRPGIALYGAVAGDRDQPTTAVASLEARVLQIRIATAGETVGYGGRETLKRASRIAIAAIGYADGYPRHAGSCDEKTGARAFVGGQSAPLLGRVSMDLIAIDVTDIDAVAPGDWVEMFGSNIPVDEVAGHARTIGYELLTGIGQRVRRHYAPSQTPPARVSHA
jgi:alanine racemase